MTIDELEEKANQQQGLNVTLLKEVAALLRAKPAAYNQATYGNLDVVCGTVACIAGHAVLLAGLDTDDFKRLAGAHIGTLAERLLGLTPRQADKLFDGDAQGWPDEYRERFWRYLGTEECDFEDTNHEAQAPIAADLLDAIASGAVRL